MGFKYGILYTELDRTDKINRLVVWGDLRQVKLYQEQFNLKGKVREYKMEVWLVKRLEFLKGKYGDEVKLLYLKK